MMKVLPNFSGKRRLMGLTLLLWALYASPSLAQGHESRLASVDVQHYSFSLALSDQHDSIRGRAEILVRFRKSLGDWSLDLVGPGAGKTGMTVSQVLENDRRISFSHRESTLTLRPAGTVQAGEQRRYTIEYAGIPADGLIIGSNRHGDRTFFGDNWPNRARHWIPTVDHPSDKATVEWIVTAPDHYQVIANGVQVEESNLSGNRKLTHWSETTPLPTKIMVIGVAPFAVQHLGEVRGIPLSSWVFPNDRQQGFYDYQQGRDVLEWFIEKLGPFPYQKLANVQSKTRYGGMENAGAIFYSESSVTGRRDQADLIAHETAHQWFGDYASEANWYHVWLSEGFATYLANRYMEHAEGREVFLERLREEREQVIAFARQRRSPIVDTTLQNINQVLNTNTYQKAGWVLHMLNLRLGDETFWKVLRTYLDRYKAGNALTADFRQVAEEISGQNLETFFQQWIFRSGFPELELKWSYQSADKTLVLDIKQAQAEPPFQFPLGIQLEGGGQKQLIEVEVNAREQRFTVPVTFAPSRLSLDPEVRLLFRQQR